MDRTATDLTHDLLLDLAGRVDDDLLAWARELVAVGETQRAVELISATLVADRAELPAPIRAALVDAARTARTELDADGALAAARPATEDTRHRFDSDPVPDVVAAVRALPQRLLVDCRVLLCRRLTPAGSAPGPLPHPVLLVEVSPGPRDRDVLAYQVADALRRAGVWASVEVIYADQPLPTYHAAALRAAQPIGPDGPGGGGTDARSAGDRPGTPPRPDAPRTDPASQRIPLPAVGRRDGARVDAERAEPSGPGTGRFDAAADESGRVEPGRGQPAAVGTSAWGRGVPGLAASPSPDGRDTEPPPVGSDAVEPTARWSAAEWGTAGSGTVGPSAVDSIVIGSSAARSSAATPEAAGSGSAGSSTTGSDTAGSSTAASSSVETGTGGSNTVGSTSTGSSTGGSDWVGSSTAGSTAAGSDTDGSDAGGSDTGGSDTGGSDTGGSDTGGSNSVGSDTGSVGSGTAGTSTGGSGWVGASAAGSTADGSDTTGSSTGGSDSVGWSNAEPSTTSLARSDPASSSAVWAGVSESGAPTEMRSAGPEPETDPPTPDPNLLEPAAAEPASDSGASRPAVIDQRALGGPVAGTAQPAEPTELRPAPRPVPGDRTSRSTAPIEDPATEVRPSFAATKPADETPGPARRPTDPTRDPRPALAEQNRPELPHRDRRHRLTGQPSWQSPPPAAARAATGNTEPLAIRASDGSTPGPRIVDRPTPPPTTGRDAAPERPTTPTRGTPAPPPGSTPSGGEPGELGLRPESVARLSASGRELLARLQAELQGGGQRPGGLTANGGGNRTGPQATVNPPDLAG